MQFFNRSETKKKHRGKMVDAPEAVNILDEYIIIRKITSILASSQYNSGEI